MPEEFNIFPEDRLSLFLEVFHSVFWERYQTKLVGGADEPFYCPKNTQVPYNTILFTRDYFSSALHEVAHWCVAGKERRTQEDYGYWYAPDGRTEEQQRCFESVEVKPQAIERIFACAAGQPFRISADNLQAGIGASRRFSENIHHQTIDYCQSGLPERAAILTQAIAESFGRATPQAHHFSLDDLL